MIHELDHCLLNELEGLANSTSELLTVAHRLVVGAPGLVEIDVAETTTGLSVPRADEACLAASDEP